MRESTHWLCAAERAIAVLLTFLMLSTGTLRAQQSISPVADLNNTDVLSLNTTASTGNDVLAAVWDGSNIAKDKSHDDETAGASPEQAGTMYMPLVVTALPTPARSTVMISGVEEGSYSVVDMFGRILVTGPFTNSQIDISEFANGPYLALIATLGEEVRSVSFTKY